MTAALSHRDSRNWIGFFVVLALLSAVALVVPLVYNLSIQLRPEQVADARRRWQEHGPADYDLEYLVKTATAGHEDGREFLVQVRRRRVVLVVEAGEIRYLDPSPAAVAGSGILAFSEEAGHYGVPALFDEIEAALHRDESDRRRSFATAQFDPKDGHPYHYVHRMPGAKERVEWNVKLTRIQRE